MNSHCWPVLALSLLLAPTFAAGQNEPPTVDQHIKKLAADAPLSMRFQGMVLYMLNPRQACLPHFTGSSCGLHVNSCNLKPSLRASVDFLSNSLGTTVMFVRMRNSEYSSFPCCAAEITDSLA